MRTVMDCLLEVSLARCYDTEGDARFRESHGRAFGSVEVGAGLDDLAGECLGHAVLGEMPVAVHCVEVELRRVDDEVVVEVIGVWHRLQKPAPLVERDFGLPAIPDTCPCLCFLRGELDGYAVVRSSFDASTRRCNDAVESPVVRSIHARISCAHALISA